MSATPAQHLIDAVATVVEAARVRSDLPDISRAADELERLRPAPVGSGSCPAKVTELLDAARLPDDPSLARLAEALRHAAPYLGWFDAYPDHDELRDLREGYFVTTLVGHPRWPDALGEGTDASVFLTVQGPGLLYPRHSHLAPELYCAVAGTALWLQGDGPFEAKAPGSWMVHPPWTSHAMQTLDEPLIALAVWTDDLDAPALLDEPVT